MALIRYSSVGLWVFWRIIKRAKLKHIKLSHVCMEMLLKWNLFLMFEIFTMQILSVSDKRALQKTLHNQQLHSTHTHY